MAASGGAGCSKGCAKVALVQLLHNTNVPSCYAAADNRLRQSKADRCRRRMPPALPAAARDPSPLAAGARSHALRCARKAAARPAVAVACKATPVWAAGSSARRISSADL